jgi:3-hydroxyisobutyrate dehydrogenase
MSKSIGFVGVGRMGANMARHLKFDCRYTVSAVYDINQDVSVELANELGCKACQTLAQVTSLSDVIITVVTDDAAMRAIYLEGGDTLLEGASGKTFINCATLSPAIHREVAAASRAAGAKILEACMASSISHAREGNLYLMVSGESEAFDANRQLLEDLSIKLRFIEGGPGKAAEVKALVNMVMNINTAGLAEGLGLAKALGHDLQMICEVFSQTGANSRVLETDAEDMIAREHDCWFSASHAAKDSGIAKTIAEENGLRLPVNDATKAQYDLMTEAGLGELDKSGIAELTFPGRHEFTNT